MVDCVFCRIARGELSSHGLVRTETVLAFLDRNPLARGHTLVIPTTHAALLQDLSAEVAADLGRALHRLVPAVCRAAGASAATVALHNGRAAGQEVPHVHWHVVPRTAGDGGGPIHALFRRRPLVADEEQAALAQQIRSDLTA
jgi:histidine triad (HIT) family protein